MIFLGDNTYEKAILQRVLQTPNPYNVRIYSLFHAYKHTALCQFWVQRTGERSVSFLAKNGASLILDADPCADMEELSAFIALTGAVSLLCDAALPLQIPGFSARICPVMRLKRCNRLILCPGVFIRNPDCRIFMPFCINVKAKALYYRRLRVFIWNCHTEYGMNLHCVWVLCAMEGFAPVRWQCFIARTER